MSLCEPVFSTVRDRPFVLVFANEKGGDRKVYPGFSYRYNPAAMWLFGRLY